MCARRFLLSIALLVCTIVWTSSPATAQLEPFDPVQITSTDTGVQIVWNEKAVSGGRATTEDWPNVTFGGLRVPARLVTIRLLDGVPADIQLTDISSEAWIGNLADLQAQSQTVPQAEGVQPLDVKDLPDAPVVVIREGRLRGERIVVLAVSTLFEQNGIVRSTTELSARVSGATLSEDQAKGQIAATGSFISSAAPPDPQANEAQVLVRVANAGIQRVTGAALAGAGLSLSSLDPTRPHLRLRGSEIPIDLRGTNDGRFDLADELRFFALPGDRWNSTTTYWLTVEATPGIRMNLRTLTPGSAPFQTTGVEVGEWRGNGSYSPSLAGVDGDHWFTGRLTAGPGAGPMSLGMPIAQHLPFADGTTVLTVTGSASVATNHTLAVTFGATTVQNTWSGWGDWARRFTFATNDVTSTVTLLPGAKPDRLDIDSVVWERPVTLDFNSRGATWSGLSGVWNYKLTGLPAGASVYDVSDPAAPAIIALSTGTTVTFQDGPLAHKYLVTGTGTLHTPDVVARQPVDLVTPKNADVIYIAPALFHNALQPLVALRTAQGHRVAVVDTQAIYDSWSGGQVDPSAIRSFLRYAAATWQPAPTDVVLVGDGTSDPRNYSGRNNTTFVPPFLAPVDPYQGVAGLSFGETACETCYAQLDGDDPLSDLLPDVALGRFPVKSVSELEQLVSKIINYERTPPGGFWRSRAIFVSDNAQDEEGTVDPAGDFFEYSEEAIALQPSGMSIQRLFFDPVPATSGLPGHDPNPLNAYARTKSLLSSGAAFVTYTGHSNEWQWAITDLSTNPNYLLGLYDADDLANGSQLPIVLEMTCLTGAFQTPAFSGTTIDERLILNPNGGAVAVWSSTGKGVSSGHDMLQKGFYSEQWKQFGTPTPANLGTLTLAGYKKLFTDGGCCQDALRTFALFGDPLTVPQVRFGGDLFLPRVQQK